MVIAKICCTHIFSHIPLENNFSVWFRAHDDTRGHKYYSVRNLKIVAMWFNCCELVIYPWLKYKDTLNGIFQGRIKIDAIRIRVGEKDLILYETIK